MFKIPNKLSIMLSLILSVAFFAVCVGLGVFLPHLVDLFIEAHDSVGLRMQIGQEGRLWVVTLAYAALLDVVVADGLLFSLLFRTRKGLVFTGASVALVRGVSWCCVLLGVLFAALGFYFKIAFMIAFVAVFLGLCLRVVKNVIEQATLIKSENDLTV